MEPNKVHIEAASRAEAAAPGTESGPVDTSSVETAPPANTPPAVETESEPAFPIRTDRSFYVLADGPRGPEATVIATFRAPADRAVYIINCNGASSVTLQRKLGEAWVYSLPIGSAACMSPPIVVPAGGEQTASIHLHDHPDNALRPPGGIESGIYRVIWDGVYTSFDRNVRGFGPELPLEQRVSAPITIQVPP